MQPLLPDRQIAAVEHLAGRVQTFVIPEVDQAGLSVADLIRYRLQREGLVRRVSSRTLHRSDAGELTADASPSDFSEADDEEHPDVLLADVDALATADSAAAAKHEPTSD